MIFSEVLRFGIDRHTPHNIIEHTHAKILVSAIGHQVS
jgi:hypothetical protein